MKTATALLTMLLSACGDFEMTSSGTCHTGGGGEGGEGTGGGEVVGAECESDNDCDQTWANDCAKHQCVDGFCKDWHLPPDYTCSDDLGSPGQCWGGQCCFTCIADLGGKPGSIDVLDGPCMAGNADSACGASGQLCQNCEIAGKVCVDGQCVEPSCATSETCACTSHLDCPQFGVECVLNACDDGECVLVNLATTNELPLDPVSGLPVGKGCSTDGTSECSISADCGTGLSGCLTSSCVGGVCLYGAAPDGTQCPGGHCVDSECVPD